MNIANCSLYELKSLLILACFARVIIPLFPINKFKLTPVNINRTTIVTIKATNVIPFSFFIFVSLLLNLISNLFTILDSLPLFSLVLLSFYYLFQLP